MEYFILLAIDGLWNVLQNGSYTIPTQVEKETHEYEIENNSILAYVQDAGKDEIINEVVSDVYKRYEVFCADCKFTPYGKTKFSRTINKLLGTESKLIRKPGESKPMRMYTLVSST